MRQHCRRVMTWAALLAIAACSAAPAPPADTVADNATSVTTAIARIETLRDELVVPGTVVPAPGADWLIYAPEAGLVAEVPFAMGDEVAPNDLLVRFDILTITEAIRAKERLLDMAARDVEDAEREISRLQPLFDQGLIARNEIEAARGRLSEAQLAQSRAQAEADLVQVLDDNTRVRARFAGIVHTAWKAPGDFVAGGEEDPVLRVVDPTRTQIAIEVPRDRLGQIQVGNVASILLPDGTGTIGTVARVEAPVDQAAPVSLVRLGYQTDEPLALDTAVRVDLTLNERTDVVVVPEEAVLRDATGPYVMVATDEMTASRRAVRVGLVTAGLAQITEGVEAGEQVVVSGAVDLLDGEAIRIAR